MARQLLYKGISEHDLRAKLLCILEESREDAGTFKTMTIMSMRDRLLYGHAVLTSYSEIESALRWLAREELVKDWRPEGHWIATGKN